MDVYRVGGSVRDEIMGVLSQDKDYVVVGSSENELLSLGYKKVGADFPVFLKDGNEYALARTELKTSTGYHGFDTSTKNVSLEDDLKRRDFTINSIAKDSKGNYIDPYNGINDIKNKILRHTSDAFIEDPLRVLRLARFKSRFVDFHIDSDTKVLVQYMQKNGLLKELTNERIYKELEKMFLTSKKSSLFFITLLDLKLLGDLFPFISEYSNKDFDILDTATNQIFQNNKQKLKILFSVLLYKIFNVKKTEETLKIKDYLTLPNNIYKFIILASKYSDITKCLDVEIVVEFFDNIQNKDSLDDFILFLACVTNSNIQNYNYFYEFYEVYTDATKLLKNESFNSGLEIKDFLYRIRILKIQKIGNDIWNKKSLI
ncbi:MAG: tRNA nucleotidyltransferase (EC (EC [uncultured Campylobacterales bacterium]|uniref:tRNA nucleotidyltransferase ) n=1 Tax=uncultured Campylobacterales bacterium TaxID=352960 RepID=A0A6S6RYX7_9BACT|nr:MAG: tRNA nucleotidyltransferase (EC (EC [uncultured Campylobacterales bacterium]